MEFIDILSEKILLMLKIKNKERLKLINLVKGQKIDLTKDNPNLQQVNMCLGWDSIKEGKKKTKSKKKGFLNTLGEALQGKASLGQVVDSITSSASNAVDDIIDSQYQPNIDIDASAMLLHNDKFISSSNDLVYYGNKHHHSGSINHSGDNLTGEGDGDDEVINVNLNKIPTNVNKIVFVVNIYGCQSRRQHFGMVSNAYIRVVDPITNKELCKFDLTDDYSKHTAIYVAELYRHNNEWKFSAIGVGTNDTSVNDMTRKYK